MVLTKVLQVNGERSQRVYDGLGEHFLYPKGTHRVVSTYFLIPQKINGKLVNGRCTLEQIADIDVTLSTDANVHYNIWTNIMVVEQN